MAPTARKRSTKKPVKGKRPIPKKTDKKRTERGVKRTRRGTFAPGTKGGPGRKRKGEGAADFAEQAISAEEVWMALAKLIRRRSPSIRAIELYLAYRHGRPWTEAELLAQREIEEARARIAAAEKKRQENGHSTAA
jgi:hypothetical protein